MREIKFRAWDKEYGRLLGVKLLHDDGSVICYDKSHSDAIAVLEPIIMQYTGLKDKNGKEIYEGDIVTCVGGYDYPEGQTGCEDPVTVQWSESSLQWVVTCENCGDETPLAEFDIEEVIGNIYENPELLKNGRQ